MRFERDLTRRSEVGRVDGVDEGGLLVVAAIEI